MNLCFGKLEIRKPTYIGNNIPEDRKNDFDIVQWDEKHSCCWSIAFLRWIPKECGFELQSVGLRFLESEEITPAAMHWIAKFAEFATCAIISH